MEAYLGDEFCTCTLERFSIYHNSEPIVYQICTSDTKTDPTSRSHRRPGARGCRFPHLTCYPRCGGGLKQKEPPSRKFSGQFCKQSGPIPVHRGSRPSPITVSKVSQDVYNYVIILLYNFKLLLKQQNDVNLLQQCAHTYSSAVRTGSRVGRSAPRPKSIR